MPSNVADMTDQILAQVELIEESVDGVRSPIRIEIGQPVRDSDGTWTCNTRVTSVNINCKSFLGADALQSLCFAIRYSRLTLELAIGRGSRFLDCHESLPIDLSVLFGGLSSD